MSSGPIVLIIRDGWGASPLDADSNGDAVAIANTPVVDQLLETCPNCLLECHGESVGLPSGQMGNSEVGHLNLGAGRVVYQELTRISRAVEDGSFFSIPLLTETLDKVQARGTRLHLMGLCSDGGVHSHLDHLFALLELAKCREIQDVVVHCFMDGRDTSPKGGIDYIAKIQEEVSRNGHARIGSIIGRYFAMDRDNRWDRVSEAYNCLVGGLGVVRADPVAAMQEWYDLGKTDEFIPSTVISDGENSSVIRDGDAVIFFNFRADRTRELTRALVDSNFDGFERTAALDIDYICMTEYDERFPLPVVFPSSRMENLFCDVVASHGVSQLRIAETEKYPHVTFFYNGGQEEPVEGETRCLIPSPKVATYDLQPEMSAPELTRQLLDHLDSNNFGVVIVNYANPDMVGHTGSIPAAVKAVETVDSCLGEVLEKLNELGGKALITADHGNAEQMLDSEGNPFTAHTTNPVHMIYVGADSDEVSLRDGILADVSPTMLALLGLPIPSEMTGSSLVQVRQQT